MSFVSGAILKTKTDSTGTPNGLFKVFADPNGATIGTFKQSAYVGVFVKELGYWTQIKLRSPLSGKQYGWILTDKVFQWTTPNTYYISSGRTGVNVRNAPSLTSGIIRKLNGGQMVGKSDGYQENGFVLFALNGGGIGWVSRDYVTRQTTTTPTGTPTTQPPVIVDDLPKEPGIDLTKYAGAAVVFLSCVLLITLVRYAVKYSK